MAGFGSRGTSGAWALPVRAAVAATGAMVAAVVLGVAGPPAIRFVSAVVPRVYVSLLGWLTPPYLYFVINGIIISIAASSKFHRAESKGEEPDPPVAAVVPRPEFVAPAPEVRTEFVAPPEEYAVVAEVAAVGKEAEKEEREEEEFVISRSSWEPKRREASETEIAFPVTVVEKEKPLVSKRFSHRKSVKASPEGKVLGVARSKRQETLESTWRTITDGRPVPLARHLKKSDTWDTHAHPVAVAAPPVRKAETFNDRRSSAGAEASPGSASRLRREPSLGQDDLNRRVEAFIKKFNEEMRLQRQQSFQHYLDMIDRGAH